MQRDSFPTQVSEQDAQGLRSVARVHKDDGGVMLKMSNDRGEIRLLELERDEHVVLNEGLYCVMFGAHLQGRQSGTQRTDRNKSTS